MVASVPNLSAEQIDRVIQMAWEDRTAFDAIEIQFGINESEVIRLMRKHMKRSSFEMWRKRVTGRKTKHLALRGDAVNRFKSSDQKGN
ncbi:MAG: TIGR03643 family protein [Herminiimonas sp.]|nr:TIGR03643 family protein [Herminiimonas sp.]